MDEAEPWYREALKLPGETSDNSGMETEQDHALAGETVQDWVGREVSVAYVRGGEYKKFTCVLAGADSFGIVALYEQDGCHLRRFLPWGAVEYVHLLDDQAMKFRRKRSGRSSVGFSA